MKSDTLVKRDSRHFISSINIIKRKKSTHLRLFELVLQITEVHVFVAQPLRATQTDPIDNGGMIQLVRQHCVIRAQHNLV